jgi:hypothetical protein
MLAFSAPNPLTCGDGPLVIIAEAAVVGQDFGVVEAEVAGDFPQIDQMDLFCVIARFGCAFGRGDVDNAQVVLARVAGWIRIDAQEFDQLDRQTDFLHGFPFGSGFCRFTVVDEATGNRPAEGFMQAFDQGDRPIGAIEHFHNDVNGGSGIAIGHGHSSARKIFV